MTKLTHILAQIDAGDPRATEELFPLVYDELRRLAAVRMASEASEHTLQPTALVHEAYLRLVSTDRASEWESRRHFFAAAAEAMRRILIERARRKAAVKHGGHLERQDFNKLALIDDERCVDLLALDEALAELERHDPRAAQLVKLRYFTGLTHQESADALGIGRGAADRLWALARAWLFRRISSK